MQKVRAKVHPVRNPALQRNLPLLQKNLIVLIVLNHIIKIVQIKITTVLLKMIVLQIKILVAILMKAIILQIIVVLIITHIIIITAILIFSQEDSISEDHIDFFIDHFILGLYSAVP